MNTCKTCKHWGGRDGAEVDEFWNDCQHDALSPYVSAHFINTRNASLKAALWTAPWRHDGSRLGHGQRPETGPDFGCIHWEAKQ